MNGLFDTFDKVRTLSSDNRDYIINHLQRKIIDKGEIFLKPGMISRHICFIESGLVQCYRIVDGKTQTMWFMKENDIIVSVGSFFAQEPSIDNLVALENTVLLSISFAELERAYQLFPEFNEHGRVIVTGYYVQSERRHHYRQQPPDLALASMMEKEAWILTRVSQKLLGSYLGKSPNTMRKAITAYHKRRKM